MKPPARILIVDDNEDIVAMLRTALARHGYRIDATTSPDEAVRLAETTAYDAALLDVVMPGRDGAALAATLRERSPGLPVALVTAYAHSPLIPGAPPPGITVFAKPVAIADLVDFLETEIRS